ncbi:di-heme oxidoredictase family protein [Nitratireductor sp. ZSWI3]|uniref:di-heme oxidoreductase family protein n=1 Tax=Nitratireductor sp. ZSWI3 TaxID=2966359 RepID=UPI00214FDA29|nr:di-heme oxidoredictase family protein [Nitratireductor sp. ZSWI3]MCR4266966.1 c-type cytochrome [Nitratireductor sp. ZSWI3]
MNRFTRGATLVGLISSLAVGAHAGDMSLRKDLSPEDRARAAEVTKPTADFSKAERFERMQAGAATSTKRINADAFSHPSANLEFAELQRFLLGNGLFRKDWVSAPSSTQASDGLGPLFNARACQSCHIKDGRGHAPAKIDDPAVSLLVRLSIPPTQEQAAAIADGRLPAAPEPVYGLQLQDFAVAGLAAEGRVEIAYEDVPVALSGGETVTLRKPALSIADPGFGRFHPDMMMSARVAPPMIGLGLLESVAEEDILAFADPDDRNGDGISGRPARVRDSDGRWQLGRFGWKGIAPSIIEQSAGAFSGDMGLSTPLAPDHWGDCTEAQDPCRALPHGAQERLGAEEVPGDLLDLVAFYSRHLAVPARRKVNDKAVLAGKKVFYEAGCASCHRPKYVTRRDVEDPALRFQLIWPYTDMLLHDMGADLADNRTEGLADGYEWRTPPLWGIGLTGTVNGEAGFLHDGRARTLLEAVLWHGGEAQAARDRVVAMDRQDRANLIRFLESL